MQIVSLGISKFWVEIWIEANVIDIGLTNLGMASQASMVTENWVLLRIKLTECSQWRQSGFPIELLHKSNKAYVRYPTMHRL